jgi:hypothetical protein
MRLAPCLDSSSIHSSGNLAVRATEFALVHSAQSRRGLSPFTAPCQLQRGSSRLGVTTTNHPRRGLCLLEVFMASLRPNTPQKLLSRALIPPFPFCFHYPAPHCFPHLRAAVIRPWAQLRPNRDTSS